jgi:hypothetical protein
VEDTGQAKEKAKDVAGQAKGRLREQVDQRSTQAGQQITTVASDVRSVAEELRTQGKDTPAQYAEQAAEKVQSAGQWLEQADGDQILRDVEGFARRNPWAVAAGGLALGLVASRFLKASSGERYRASLSQDNGAAPSSSESLAAEPTPSGAATAGSRFEREAPEPGDVTRRAPQPEPEPGHPVPTGGSMISTEPRT